MTSIRPAVEIAARRATAARVDALLAETPGDPLEDPSVVASLAGWLASGARGRGVDAVRPATSVDLGLATATASALGLAPRAGMPPLATTRVLVVGFDHREDGAFEEAIGTAEEAGARVVGAAAVREAGPGCARLVAPRTGRMIPFRALTRREVA